MDLTVRKVRRSTTRLLRAMDAAGYGPATWPHDVVTRLAHLDCITARYLIDPQASDLGEVERSRRELLELQRRLWDVLGPGERADVKRNQLQVRIVASELHLPFLCQNPFREDGEEGDALASQTLTSGIVAVQDDQLTRIMQRLGLRVRGPTPDRAAVEAHLRSLLADDQMIGVLVATLDDAALELLAALVRGEVDEETRTALAVDDLRAAAVGDESSALPYEAAVRLRDCGLAFAHSSNHGQRLWVPVDLQARLDGVLRVFGM